MSSDLLDQPETETDDLVPSDTLTTIAIVEADERAFKLKQRQAMALAASSLVPKQYQGKDKVPDIMIAMDMAARLNTGAIEVMQSLYIVHGKPGWSAQFLIATFNACGRFSAIKYRFNEDKSECVAHAKELATGEVVEGPPVSLEMAKSEGWATKNGSKWKTLPELMLRYRAATFLIRSTAPEIGLGLMTKDELQDID